MHFTSLWKGKVSCLLVSLINHNTKNQIIGYFTMLVGTLNNFYAQLKTVVTPADW